ncbi:hypothetical protein E2C01_023678 [Portunus trituberculatus]|uniref:Uncharacterized protein n=1 Tax=Portunus trituberculatus TaxID=210409 RepID=A0A5B7EC87_PORTR|nr:hypothetical protein [Portunus trituberculatus]
METCHVVHPDRSWLWVLHIHLASHLEGHTEILRGELINIECDLPAVHLVPLDQTRPVANHLLQIILVWYVARHQVNLDDSHVRFEVRQSVGGAGSDAFGDAFVISDRLCGGGEVEGRAGILLRNVVAEDSLREGEGRVDERGLEEERWVRREVSEHTHLHQRTPFPSQVSGDSCGEGGQVDTLQEESVGFGDAEGVIQAGGGRKYRHVHWFLAQHHLKLGQGL